MKSRNTAAIFLAALMEVIPMLTLFCTCMPYLSIGPALSQTKIPPPGSDLGIDNRKRWERWVQTQRSSRTENAIQQTTLIQQAAEQNTQGVITNTNNQLLQGSELGRFSAAHRTWRTAFRFNNGIVNTLILEVADPSVQELSKLDDFYDNEDCDVGKFWADDIVEDLFDNSCNLIVRLFFGRRVEFIRI
jgi:hypothetical protein